MSAPKRGLGPIQIGILIAALVVATAAFTANLVGANSVCALRTSYCASSTDKNGLYKGALYGPDGKPYRDARILVHFDSREDLSHVTFRTDHQGHVCIVWAHEAIGPYPMTWFYSELWAKHAGLNGFGVWRNLHGAKPPPGCQQSSATIPWYRASDLHESWQYLLLFVTSALSIVILSFALVLWRRPRSRLLGAVGISILLADLIAGVILWNL
jgi:hypothetical protein